MDDIFDSKHPQSKNKHQCLGPCYHPKTWITHPITLENVTDIEKAFCPVGELDEIDPKTGNKTSHIIDECSVPTSNKQLSDKELELNILIPNIDFTCEHFLKIYYNVYSFEDAINWILTNKHVPYLTKKRVLDCSWRTYHKEMELVDSRLVDIYIDIIKKKWMPDVINEVGKYV